MHNFRHECTAAWVHVLPLNLKQMPKCIWMPVQKNFSKATNVTSTACARCVNGMPQLVILVGVTTLPSSATAGTNIHIGNVANNILPCFFSVILQPRASMLHFRIFLIVNDVFRWVMFSPVCDHLVYYLRQILISEFRYQ